MIHVYPYWQIHEEIVGVSGYVNRQGGRTAVSAKKKDVQCKACFFSNLALDATIDNASGIVVA